MNNNVMQLSNCTQFPVGIFFLLFLPLIQLSPSFLIFFMRLHLINTDHVLEEKCLHSKVEDMALTANPMVDGIPVDFFFCYHPVTDYAAELVVCRVVVRHYSTQLSRNPVILKYWQKCIPLLLCTMTGYFTKPKECMSVLLIAINEMGADCKQKFCVWRCPYIYGDMDVGQCRLHCFAHKIFLR